MKFKTLKFIISIVICQAAGFFGSLFTTPKIATWYQGVTKPSFNPPNYLFGPVWTLLFILMGISLYIIWISKFKDRTYKKEVITIFAIQLVLNIFWSILFFGFESPMLAFFEIIALWVSIFATIIGFYKISKIASLILIPYILWVSFASVLNFFIWKLNF